MGVPWGYGWGRKRAGALTKFIWRNSKNGGATDCCTQQLLRGFWTLQYVARHPTTSEEKEF